MHINIYKSHYTIDDKQIPIPFNSFLDCINNLTLPDDSVLLDGLSQQKTGNGGSALSSPAGPIPGVNLNDLFPASSFKNGSLVVHITDHRYNPPVSAPAQLKPSLGWLEREEVPMDKVLPYYYSVDLDVPLLHQEKAEPSADVATELDLNVPVYSKSVSRIAQEFNAKAMQHYNSQKFKTKNRVSKKSQPMLDTIMDPVHTREFVPRFSQYKFVQDWRQKQQLASTELLIGLGDKNKIKINPMGNTPRKMLIHNLNRRIIRTLRFESNHTKKIYTILNVYEIPETLNYEGVLRWGTVEGTAVNGDTLKFPLGNKQAVEYYIMHFKGFYGILHTLISDSAER